MNWIDIGALDDVPLRGARLVKSNLGCIAVFRTDEAEVFATSNTCVHRGGPLSEGIVHGRRVTCPLHNFVYSLETGEVQGPDEGRIATYPIRVENGRLLLMLVASGPSVAPEHATPQHTAGQNAV